MFEDPSLHPNCRTKAQSQCNVTALMLNMTRVVPDQKTKFENDELFRKLSRESEVRYTGYRDRSHEERVSRFHADCREGRCPISFVANGTNILLFLGPQSKEKKTEQPAKEFLDYDKEPGKAHLKSRFIMNGVCVMFKGYVDVQRLDGAGFLEYDESNSKVEEKHLRETMEQSRLRLQEFEERQRRIKQEPMEATEAPFTTQDIMKMVKK
ncbi:core-binding factor subunit beta-like isoform X2 [Rhopilema esculentum]|uniref:core-binding factor subunit beta-like isoform X2 n=1 Tax=Rhopilema esculentum TaxID=499914 RepID=UPI0031D86194